MDNNEDIMAQIENIKNQLNNLQKELKEVKIYGGEKGGPVRAVFNGKGKLLDYQFKNIKVSREIKNTLINATNQGLKKVKENEIQRKKEIVGDVNLPDMPGLF